MPAYNPPEQILFSPVSNFYQGKAIRQQLAAGEQEKELKGLQIDLAKQEVADAPSKRAAAREKALLDIENLTSQIDERYAKGERDKLVYADTIMKPLFAAYSNEKDENKALEIFNTGLPEAISRLPQDQQDNFIKMAGPDRVFDHDEINRAGLARRLVEEKEKVTPSDRAKRAVEAGLEPGSPEYNSFVLNQGGDAGRQRDDEIRDAEKILRDMGVPDAATEAIKQVDGKIVYTVDPNGGAIYRTDKLANGGMGRTVEVDIQGGPRQPRPEIKHEDTLWGLAEEATGVGPGAKAIAAQGLGPLGLYTANATTEAQAKFSAAENTLIRAFSLNPRYPVAEQNRIKGNIQVKPKFWDSAEQMHSRMSGIRSFLEQERDTAAWESTRPGIGRAQKTIEENTVADIDRFLSLLGEPPENNIKANAEALSKIDAEIAALDAEIEAARRGR